MFDSIKTLILVNVQSHEQTVLNFKRNGIHRISGDNSHGKSVVMKSLYTLLMGENLNKAGRDSMINWFKEFCIISAVSYNGVMLTLYLHLESSKCFYELDYGGKKIRKSLADDYKTLLKVANFHYLPDEKFSINRYKTKTTLPYTHTSGTLNYKILDSASEVPQAKEVTEVVDEKLKEIKLDKENIERKIISLTEQIRTMDDSGILELENRISYVDSLYKNYNIIQPVRNLSKTIVSETKEIESITINDFKESEPIIKQLKVINKVRESLTLVVNAEHKIKELESSSEKEPVDIRGILSKLNTIRVMKEINDEIIATKVRLDKIKDTDVINLDNLIYNNNIIGKMNLIMKEIVVSENELSKLNEIEEPVDISELLKTTKLLSGLTNNLKEGRKINKDIVNVNLNMLNINNDINSLIKDIGICKHCGSTLTENHHHKIL